jgi:hypothetical protein
MKQALKDEVQSYFETLATLCKYTLHGANQKKAFYRLKETVANNLPGYNAKAPYVKVSEYTIGYEGGSELLDKFATVGIDFLVKPASATESDQDAAIVKAEQIWEMFLTRIQRDITMDENCALLELVDFNRITVEEIGPVNQGEIGVRVHIPFRLEGPEYNDDNFTDTDTD